MMASGKVSRKAVTVKKGGAAPRKRAAEAEEAEGPLFNPLLHRIVPKHEKLSEKDARELKDRYHLTLMSLPKISMRDPALRDLSLKQGDIVKISRKSYTAGETVFYRGVVDE